MLRSREREEIISYLLQGIGEKPPTNPEEQNDPGEVGSILCAI